MKPTANIHTLRANGFSVINCTSYVCKVEASFPFFIKMNSGEMRLARQSRNDAWQFCFRGQFKNELPKQVSI